MLFAKNSSNISSTFNIHSTASKKKKGNGALEEPRARQSWRKGDGLRPLSPYSRTWRTGFLPTDLELCLFHKIPFLDRVGGTGESGFDRVR